MNPRFPFAALVALSALPAAAQDLGPADVAQIETVMACPRDRGPDAAYWACLDASGMSPGALTFARQLAASDRLPGPGFLLGFTELGPVDLGDVVFPFLANTNDQSLLLNGAGGPVQPQLGPRPEDPQSRALMREYPDAMPAFRMTVVGHRLTGAVQRFVVSDQITDGCRACALLGQALSAMVFRDGVLERVEPLGWLADDATEGLAEGLKAGSLRALQIALTLRGYAPGRMDGRPGDATDAALRAFLSDQCLPVDEGLSEAALTRLTEAPMIASRDALTPPDCAE
ncbi:peptidoglycan-binding domain-containing protein [Pararhodobacter marinus]|uniref:peptidoglycan-binding domain-containing protein n=1 Tax=Pararhodobacter marinus TaxID=2184063 RepID=UPI003512B450